MEHSDRGKYVTEQVQLWVENDREFIENARAVARTCGVDELRDYLTFEIQNSFPSSAPWQVGRELAPNDYARVDWEGIAKSLLEEA